MKQDDAMIAHYIRAYGLHAIFVAIGRGRSIAGTTGNIRAAMRRIKSRHGRRARLHSQWWCNNREDAEAVLRAAIIEPEWPADDVSAIIENTAAEAGVGLAPAALVSVRAEIAVAAIRSQIETMRKSGDMKAVNAAFRAMREQRLAAGLPTMPYPVFLRRHEIQMLYDVAKAARARAQREGGEV